MESKSGFCIHDHLLSWVRCLLGAVGGWRLWVVVGGGWLLLHVVENGCRLLLHVVG